MKNFLKKYYKDILINFIFVAVYFLIYFFVCKNGKYLFASKVDFDVQHYILPEYLRKVFYNSHTIFPKFSFNLGSGTNIFNISYYGLFNPIILISFLFPKLEMLYYIIFSMMFIVLSSVSLLYFYLRKNGYSYKISFICSFIFLCSAPLIFHSHRHIMFMDYFPFLILGFYGIDNLFKNNKSFLLIISIILMILTSYYYSVSGIVVLFLYAIYKYMKENSKMYFKNFFFMFKGLFIRIFSAILITSFLLAPTAFALINGRGTNHGLNFFKDLFSFKDFLLYKPYSIGLTLISLISILYFIVKGKKHHRFLALILLLCSFTSFPSLILNAFLYIDGKSLIPFVILAIILIAEFLNIILSKIKFNNIIIIYLIISSFLTCVTINKHDNLITKNDLNKNVEDFYINKVNSLINDNDIYRIKSDLLGKKYINKVANILEYKTTSYLSSNNNNYYYAYNDLFENPLIYRNSMMFSASNNLLFEIYMGEKYVFSPYNYDNIYEKIDSYNNINLYENKYVLPIGYATNNFINSNDFNKLSYPDNIINMIGNVISENKSNVSIKTTNNFNNNNYYVTDYNKLKYKEIDNGYIIDSSNDGLLELKTDYNMDNKILFISFDIDDNHCGINGGDLSITINNIKNYLTCSEWKYYNNNNKFNYIITDSPNLLKIKFKKGIYKITNIQLKMIDLDSIINLNNDIEPFIIDKKNSTQDKLSGNIELDSDSFFTMSIPYDKNFIVKVDGNMINYEKTNNSFIGFPIKEGSHYIEISYNIPGWRVGLLLSFIGVVLCLFIIIFESRLNLWLLKI